MSNAQEMTTEMFDTAVADGTALIDFHASWCGPCKQIAPIVDELAAEYHDRGLKVGKVDIDQAQELAVRFGIMSVPTLLFFKDGQKVDEIRGAVGRQVLEEKIKSFL